MVPAAIVSNVSFVFCANPPGSAPLRCIATMTTQGEFPEGMVMGYSEKEPTWKKFREYKFGTRWIRWSNWRLSMIPSKCKYLSDDKKTLQGSFYRSSTAIEKSWIYPSIPTATNPKPPFVLSPVIEISWPDTADNPAICDELVDCSPLSIVNEDGSPATGTIPWNSTLDFKTAGVCCFGIVWSTNKGSITQDGVLTASCCPCGSIQIKAICPGCETEATHNITVTGDCSALTIVNENGSPATDTILRNGSLNFKTTGTCCGAIEWTVSPETGGTTISDMGVLTAGATSCGSLLVTASCPDCGTSDTQYVRVTDAGKWIRVRDTQYCDIGTNCSDITCISGNTKIYTYYEVDDNVKCPTPCPSKIYGVICPLSLYSCPETTPPGCVRYTGNSRCFNRCQYKTYESEDNWVCE